MSIIVRLFIVVFLSLSVSGCGGGGLFKSKTGSPTKIDPRSTRDKLEGNESMLDLFTNAKNPNVTIAVNKYIWSASLDVLNFLPIEAADPFSGVIVTGWGRAKGASRSYRATIFIQDAALDARSLRVALVTKSGPANKDTITAIEDAILTRARQLRIADGKL